MPSDFWVKYANDVLVFQRTGSTGGGPTISTTYNGNLILEVMNKSWTSVNSPRVDGKLSLRANPYTLTKIHVTYEPYSLTRSGSGGLGPSQYAFSETSKVVDQELVFVPSERFNKPEGLAYEQALTKWYQRCAAQRANLGELFATRRQTVGMITQTANRLAQAAGRLHRGDLGGAAAALGVSWNKPGNIRPAQAWLEMQYGWKPLLSDVYEAVEGSFRPESIYISSSATETESFSYNSDKNNATFIEAGCNFKTRVNICAKVTVADRPVSNMGQLGLLNPALLAWELLPYSFVVDWFIPIGGYLEAQTATAGLVVSDGSVTTTRSYDMRVQRVLGRNYPSDYTSFSPSTNMVHVRSKVRTLGTPGGPPLPKFKNPVSITHGLNAIALLAEAFRKR